MKALTLQKNKLILAGLIAFAFLFLTQISVQAYTFAGGWARVKTIGSSGEAWLTIGSSNSNPDLNIGIIEASEMPSVTTGTPTNVGSTATLNGNISSMGVASSTYAYFQWWYDGGAINTTPLQTKNAIGAVTQSITFDPNKVLNTRIVATVGSVSVYGSTTTLLGIQGNSFFKTFIPILFGLVVAFVILSIAFSAGITIQILAIAAVGGTLAYYVVAAIINLLF